MEENEEDRKSDPREEVHLGWTDAEPMLAQWYRADDAQAVLRMRGWEVEQRNVLLQTILNDRLHTYAMQLEQGLLLSIAEVGIMF